MSVNNTKCKDDENTKQNKQKQTEEQMNIQTKDLPDRYLQTGNKHTVDNAGQDISEEKDRRNLYLYFAC